MRERSVESTSSMRRVLSGNFQENKREEDAGIARQKAKYWFTIFMAQ